MLLLNILFGLVTLGIIGTSVWYVPHRLIELLHIEQVGLFYILAIATIVLSLVFMMAFAHSPNVVLGNLSTVAGWVFGLHLFLTLLLLLTDGVRLFISTSDSTTAWAVIAVALVITTYGAISAQFMQVTQEEISLRGLNQEVRIIHISDVHLGHQRGRSHIQNIVDLTNAQKPDFVLINGDLVDANAALEPGVLDPMSEFDAPVYFTTGNHEHYVDYDRAISLIEKQGVRILNNELVETHGIQLIGLEYMNADEETFDAHSVNDLTIKDELPKIARNDSVPVILQHHSPVGIEYAIENKIDLMVSGHTHAGQVFPATLIAPLMFPLNKGYYEKEGTKFFVSQGAGTFGPRMRLGSRNEINLIKLIPGK